MAPKSPAEYEAEIAALEAQLDRLRNRSATIFAAAPPPQEENKPQRLTVFGREEMIIDIGADDAIGYVNSSMAPLLGIEDREAATGTPYQQWDNGPIGEDALAELVALARGADQPQILERPCPGLDIKLLPNPDEPRPAGDPVLRFTATKNNDRVQIVIQDVTRTRWLESTFSRYVSPSVIEQMQGMTATDFLQMERREITVVFGDLRGFTRMSQELPPEAVQEVVNSFLANTVSCVERLEGTVDKFVGDEIMALFGAPIPQADHGLRALVCALEMQRSHAQWMAQRQAEGLPAEGMGVGMATGPVVVGNIGTASRMDYTALGHTVNLAARLCGAAEAGEVLTVLATHTAAMASVPIYQGAVPAPQMGFMPKGKMNFKNVDEAIDVFAVVAQS